MKAFIRRCAVLGCAAFLSQAEAAAPPPPSDRSLSLGAGLYFWDFSRLEGFDEGGTLGGGAIGHFRLYDFFALELRLSGFAIGESRDIETEDGQKYETDVTVVAMPLEADAVFRLPLGEKFHLYGGPGIGFYLFDGQSHGEQDDRNVIYNVEVEDEFGGYVLAGLHYQFSGRIAAIAEGKYTWIKTEIEKAAAVTNDTGVEWDAPDLNFSGLSLHLGLLFTF